MLYLEITYLKWGLITSTEVALDPKRTDFMHIVNNFVLNLDACGNGVTL
jgi:hypothetical protein